MVFLLKLISLASGVCMLVSAHISDRVALKNSLLEGYRRDTRPVYDSSTSTDVSLLLALRQILDMDMRNEIISARMDIVMRWTDEFLKWNASDYGGIESIHFYANTVWTPDIIMYNEIHDRSYLNEILLKRLRVYHDGTVHWPSPISVVSSCPLDMISFPWDEQICTWRMGSWVYPLQEMNVLPESNETNYNHTYVKHGEWELVDFFHQTKLYEEGIGGDLWPTVSFSARLKRKPLFYIVNLIVPSILIAGLALLAFCAPADGGEKITVSITVLLASTVFTLVVNDTMPVQSYTIPTISEFYLAMLCCLVLATVATVFVTAMHYRGSGGHVMCPALSELTHWLAGALRVPTGKRHNDINVDGGLREETGEPFNWRVLANCLDRLFLVVFFCSFLLCFTVILG